MKAIIYCVTCAKGKQAFYLKTGAESHLLFVQNYKKSNRDMFGRGKVIDEALSITGVHSTATIKTIERLRPAIRYVEKEYGICVLDSTAKKDNKKKIPYKRQKFTLASLDLLAA